MLCDRIAATQRSMRSASGLGRHQGAKGILDSQDFTAEERELLGLIADGVVERYAKANDPSGAGGLQGGDSFSEWYLVGDSR